MGGDGGRSGRCAAGVVPPETDKGDRRRRGLNSTKRGSDAATTAAIVSGTAHVVASPSATADTIASAAAATATTIAISAAAIVIAADPDATANAAAVTAIAATAIAFFLFF